MWGAEAAERVVTDRPPWIWLQEEGARPRRPWWPQPGGQGGGGGRVCLQGRRRIVYSVSRRVSVMHTQRCPSPPPALEPSIHDAAPHVTHPHARLVSTWRRWPGWKAGLGTRRGSREVRAQGAGVGVHGAVPLLSMGHLLSPSERRALPTLRSCPASPALHALPVPEGPSEAGESAPGTG